MALSQGHRKLLEDGEKQFTNRRDLESFWQTAAEHFYPEMASFTTTRSAGEDFASNLATSYPLLARRTLGDALSALLRPVNLNNTSPGVWFSMRAEEYAEDVEGRRWLEWATGTMRRAMYDRDAMFVRATKEGDHAFATFGQAPLSVEMNNAGNGLLYRCWHLRDVAWCENSEGKIDAIWRKWKPTAVELGDAFGDKVAGKVKERLSTDPYSKIDCRHIVISTKLYEQRSPGGKRYRTPYVSLWIDVDNGHVMEETPSWSRVYVIPRWVTIPGSAYATSPAVTAALPDARLLQAMMLTTLDASEKFADPPLLAVQEAIRSDISVFPGGVTYLDSEYDERMGEALRPLYHQAAGQGLSASFELQRDVREMMAKAFFLDSLALPPSGTKEMTAFEVGERISEWIRRALPIFEPMEFEYNGALCEETFDIMLRNGAFGSVEDIPQSLRGADIKFKFESPLHASADYKKGQKLLEAKSALVQMAELDPGVVPILNASDALRDVLTAIGAPAKWMRSEEEVAAIEEQKRQAQAMQEMLAGATGAAGVAKDLGSAAQSFATAQATGQQPAA